jgi:hypothetical protein
VFHAHHMAAIYYTCNPLEMQPVFLKYTQGSLFESCYSRPDGTKYYWNRIKCLLP